MQDCISLQTNNHASTPTSLSFFTGRMPFLPPNQQCQSTEGMFVHVLNSDLFTLPDIHVIDDVLFVVPVRVDSIT